MFDQNMFDELSKLKVDKKKKKPAKPPVAESYYEPPETDGFEDEPIPGPTQKLEEISEFMKENIEQNIDPRKYMAKETSPEHDFSTDEGEAKAIAISGRQAVRSYQGEKGTEMKSSYLDEAGNINVVYHSPGKNVVNRKTAQEARLDLKMEALSGLISRFKTEEEKAREASDPNVIIMDQGSKPKKDVKRIEQIVNIEQDIELKVELVKETFRKLEEQIIKIADLPVNELDITNPENLKALYNNKSIDDLDVTRIFTLALFLETPDNFPNNDTQEQILYRNKQVGAKVKIIDLKRLLTYISSESEFHKTIDLIAELPNRKGFKISTIKRTFDFKCNEVLAHLKAKYLKNQSNLESKVNILSLQKEVEFYYRNYDSTLNFVESLKSKIKVLPKNFKDQIKRTKEQLADSEQKVENLLEDIRKMEMEMTILLLLYMADSAGGYDKRFMEIYSRETIEKQIRDFRLKFESETIQEILEHGIQEKHVNEILQNR